MKSLAPQTLFNGILWLYTFDTGIGTEEFIVTEELFISMAYIESSAIPLITKFVGPAPSLQAVTDNIFLELRRFAYLANRECILYVPS